MNSYNPYFDGERKPANTAIAMPQLAAIVGCTVSARRAEAAAEAKAKAEDEQRQQAFLARLSGLPEKT